MKIKKKVCNRILTLVLATALIFSSSVVASAAELAEGSENSKGAISSVVEDDITTSSSSDEFIKVYFGNRSEAYTTTGTVPCDGKLVVKVDVTGSAKIKVNLKSGLFWSTLYDDSVTNGTFWKISNGTVKQGWTVEVKVTPVSTNASFEISAWIE